MHFKIQGHMSYTLRSRVTWHTPNIRIQGIHLPSPYQPHTHTHTHLIRQYLPQQPGLLALYVREVLLCQYLGDHVSA